MPGSRCTRVVRGTWWIQAVSSRRQWRFTARRKPAASMAKSCPCRGSGCSRRPTARRCGSRAAVLCLVRPAIAPPRRGARQEKPAISSPATPSGSYRELDQDGRQFSFPTTSPSQFDPARCAGRSTAALLRPRGALRHALRPTDGPDSPRRRSAPPDRRARRAGRAPPARRRRAKTSVVRRR